MNLNNLEEAARLRPQKVEGDIEMDFQDRGRRSLRRFERWQRPPRVPFRSHKASPAGG